MNGKTKIKISFKGKHQLPLFMVIKLWYNKDGDVIFAGANKPMYNLLMTKTFEVIKEFVKGSGSSARQNLMDLYQYELKGFNKLNRPRAEVLDLLRDKIGSFGNGISAITVNDLDDDEE